MKLIEVPALFYLAHKEIHQKTACGKIQKIYIILNFPALNFLVRRIKERENHFFSVILYPVFLYTLVEIIQYAFYILKEYVGSLAT